MPDRTTHDILARLEAEMTTMRGKLEAQEAELAAYRRARRPRRAVRRTPRRLGRGRGRLGAALVLALLLASVPFSLLATDRFPDVPTANPHHDDVNQIAAAGITIGFPDGTYKPDAFVTRGQMASFLARTAGLGGRTPVANAATALAATNATNATNAQNAVNAQTATTVVDGAITTAKLADGAVTTAKIGAGGAAAGQVLTANGSGGASFQTLPPPPTGTSANTPDTLVRRDAAGNFAAGTITATLNGDAASVDGKSANELVRVARGQDSTQRSLNGTFQTIGSVTITAPAPGLVSVDSAVIAATFGTGLNIAQFRLRDTTTNATSLFVEIVTTQAAGETFEVTVSPTSVFQVTAAGARTFVLEALVTSGSSSTINATVTALYVPFGSTGTGAFGTDQEVPAAPAPGDGPAIKR